MEWIYLVHDQDQLQAMGSTVVKTSTKGKELCEQMRDYQLF
jgi:hypothetical protein